MAGTKTAMDDVFQRLRSSLPFVHVRREEARDSPELCRLLLQLSEKVDETGLTRSTAAELCEERARLAQTVSGFHSARLLHSLLEQMATRPSDTDHADVKLGAAVRECLSLAELRAALPLSPSADPEPESEQPQLLQLTADQMTPTPEERQTLARLPRALERTLSGLALQYAAVTDPAVDGTAAAEKQLPQLPAQLRQLQRTRQLQRQRLQTLLQRRDAQQLRQAQLLARQLEMLLTLINKHQLEHKVDVERKSVDHLTGSIQGMQLKIRLLQLQIQCDTYTEQCLAALRAAGRHVRAQTARLDSQLSAAKQQLANYQTAGAEFATLAHRYRQLCQEADHQRWLLSEMASLEAAGTTPGAQ